MTEAYIAELYDASTAAGALSELTALAGTKAERERIDALLPDRTILHTLLSASAPKIRKNAARLIGALMHTADADALIHALHAETTLFTVPSILLALGNVGGSEARAAVAAYAIPDPADETQAKHCREIAAARDKALSKLSADEPLPVYTLTAPRTVLLVAPDGFSDILQSELTALGYTPVSHPRGAYVTTDNLQKLFRARCFTMLLLPLASDVPVNAEAIAAVAAPALTLPYRIELTGYVGDRRAFIRSLTALLPAGNAPSHYALELTIECRSDACDIYLRPASIPDGRLSYRKRAIAASIAPATAACLARLAADTFRQTGATHAPNAFDPFCGSATLLIELDKHQKCASLFGTDIKAAALDAARTNAAAAHIHAQFIQKDCTRFVPKSPFDIVLSNMPFGNRVGTHENNEPLYRDFVRRLPGFLTDSGIAVLYTAEYHLLHKCIRQVPALTLLSSLRTEAGGLLPWVFVLQKRA